MQHTAAHITAVGHLILRMENWKCPWLSESGLAVLVNIVVIVTAVIVGP